jgi:pilus assembly protein CpaF
VLPPSNRFYFSRVLDYLTVRSQVIDQLRENLVASPGSEVIVDDFLNSALAAHDGLAPEQAANLKREVLDEVIGLGPLQPFLDDPKVEEIWVNSPNHVFIRTRDGSYLTSTILSESQIEVLVERMLKPTGRRLDLSNPFVDATLADGSRLHVVIPDITHRNWAVNIRKFDAGIGRLDHLVNSGSLTQQAAGFLSRAVAAGLNVVVSGGTGAGKTTLLTCLLAALPTDKRVVTCEEVFELRLSNPDWVAMQTRAPSLEGTGEIRLRRLIKESLRMRPDCLVVGEVRQEEALDLLIALNSGTPGMGTVHANSARDAVNKLCTLPLLAGENVTAAFVVPTVAATVDLVVHCGFAESGKRAVLSVVALSGRVEGSAIEITEIFRFEQGELIWTGVPAPQADLRGVLPTA